MSEYPIDSRNKVKRIPKRGHYDRETIYNILDAGFLCHIGFVVDGQPFVIPTAYGRSGDKIYLHGATTSRMLVNAQTGIPLCLTVTYLDGLVVARSAFHSSMNYRSAVIFGKAELVKGQEETEALKIITEHILKGRWEECRQPNAREMKATSVLRMDIDQASAKIRTGPPGDDEADLQLDIWAGVVPLKRTWETPQVDPTLQRAIPIPNSVVNLFEKLS